MTARALQTAALRFADATRAVAEAQKPLAEFDRMTAQWAGQREFRWAGVALQMDEGAVGYFRGQLLRRVMTAQTNLANAEDELSLLGKPTEN